MGEGSWLEMKPAMKAAGVTKKETGGTALAMDKLGVEEREADGLSARRERVVRRKMMR